MIKRDQSRAPEACDLAPPRDHRLSPRSRLCRHSAPAPLLGTQPCLNPQLHQELAIAENLRTPDLRTGKNEGPGQI
jgi:hypothetical protein